MTNDEREAQRDRQTAEPLALRLNDQLGRLVDAEMAAYHDAAYADHGSARDQLERFAAAVQAAERERCAKLCESVDLSGLAGHSGWLTYTSQLCASLAAMIRGV